MIDRRNDYGFPRQDPDVAPVLDIVIIGFGDRRPRQPTKLERAQDYAADVRARRGMVVRKGVYLDLIK